MALPLPLIGFGFKVMGFGKRLWGFITNNWKWLLPLALLVASYFYVNYKIDQAYDNGYTAGVTYEIERQRQKIEIENQKNRQFEEMLSKAISDFGRTIARETSERVIKEKEIRTRVETIIRDNPIYQQCKVDPEVLEDRNKLRALGPIRMDLNEVPSGE